tara:strand:- start:1262 stop:1537 length:276 start_codon:yes stop_codon:yes gene_type:complete
MIINKKLKNAEFEYNEETKKFLIIDPENGDAVELNKVYAFAFMRFVVRMAQRNWLRQPKKNQKILDKTIEDMVDLENIDHPDQMDFNLNIK